MVPPTPFAAAMADSFYALGLGLLLSALYCAVRLISARGIIFSLPTDILACVLGAIAYMSFAAHRSYAGTGRWYTVAAMICGYLAFRLAFGPVARWISAHAARIFTPIRAAFSARITKPLVLRAKARREAKRAKRETKRKVSIAKNAKSLPNTAIVLYNSN